MLTHRQSYVDVGADHFDKLHTKERTCAMVKRLEGLGCEVILKPSAARHWLSWLRSFSGSTAPSTDQNVIHESKLSKKTAGMMPLTKRFKANL
jgi:hypothetical protein